MSNELNASIQVSSTTNGKTRVLLIVEACNPTWTSVPLVGYNFARALVEREDLELTIATHVRNEEAIRDDEIFKLAKWLFIDNERVAAPLYRFGELLRGGKTKGFATATGLYYFAYQAFEKQLYHDLKSEIDSKQFDLIHRITPVSPTMASALVKWTDIPLLIGPINGGVPWPAEYPQLQLQENEWLWGLRDVVKMFPAYRRTYAKAAGVIVASRSAESTLPSYYKGQRFFMAENGVDPKTFKIADKWAPPQGKFKFVNVGRIVPLKGIWLILDAISRSDILKQTEFHLVGDGPDLEPMKKMAAELNLTEQVKFHGWMKQEEVGEILRTSQAFVFPSLREFGGGAVLEAMANGLPSIVMDYGGPAELVREGTGIKLPMMVREPLVEQLKDAMELLASNLDLCEQYGNNACQIVRDEFTWRTKAGQMVDIYHQLLGREMPASVEREHAAVDEPELASV